MLNKELSLKIDEANEKLKNKTLSIDREQLRRELETIGEFKDVKPMKTADISTFLNGRPIFGIDASYTSVGESFPNIIYFAKALAKGSRGKKIEVSNVIEFFDDAEKARNTENPKSLFSKEVTKMELDVSIKAIEEHNPHLNIHDGGFWRLQKDDVSEDLSYEQQWPRLKKMAIDNNTFLIGVIEDIGSYELWDRPELDSIKTPYLDSSLLFGVLDKNEIYILNGIYQKDFRKVFARFSNELMPIACDFLPEQEDQLVEVLSFLNCITSSSNRGYPEILDITDKQVKITQEMTEFFLTRFDPVIQEQFLMPKRLKR